jgi:hypothetical protein
MGDRIVTEPFLDDIIGYLATATHGRPYVQVHNLIAAIRALPEVAPLKPPAEPPKEPLQ